MGVDDRGLTRFGRPGTTAISKSKKCPAAVPVRAVYTQQSSLNQKDRNGLGAARILTVGVAGTPKLPAISNSIEIAFEGTQNAKSLMGGAWLGWRLPSCSHTLSLD